MNLVRVNGSKGFLSLWISVICYFISLIIYVISFCLSDWIVYTSIPIKIGIWRLCDIQILGYDRCADWSSRSYPTNISNSAFLGPPDFIRTSQSLEVVAFVFFVITGILLLIGLCQRSMGLLFFASSMSMFLTEIFLCATIGLFAGKGKTSHIGYLSYAWWLALIAFVIAFICAIALFILSFYILPSQTIIDNQNKINESNDKMFYSSTPYSNNVYVPQDFPTDYIQQI